MVHPHKNSTNLLLHCVLHGNKTVLFWYFLLLFVTFWYSVLPNVTELVTKLNILLSI